MALKIFLAGHRGMVGGAILRRLRASQGTEEVVLRSHAQLDLTTQDSVRVFMRSEKPDVVILAAARVGGIHANDSQPASFIYENLMIQSNVIHQAFRAGVQKLLFLGSSCIYPRLAQQPIREEALLEGALEPTNEPYAVAKIAGIKLCESYNRQYGVDYRSVMPTNLYGPGDNFHPEQSHVIPALLRRFHLAAVGQEDRVVVWGTGSPRRDFLHVDDLADAALYVLRLPLDRYQAVTTAMRSHLNVGSGADLSIADLSHMIAEITRFKGRVEFDTSKPNGTPRKMLDTSRLERLGWSPKIQLREGLEATYSWFVRNLHTLRR